MRMIILILVVMLAVPFALAETKWENNCNIKVDDGKKNVIIGRTEWVKDNSDGECKGVMEAKSLVNTSIKCVVRSDGIHIAECLDWNMTAIKLKYSIDEKAAIDKQDIPIRVLAPEYNEKEERVEYIEKWSNRFDFDNDLIDGMEPWIEIEPGDIIHFGESSTEIILQDNETEVLDDIYFIDGSVSYPQYAWFITGTNIGGNIFLSMLKYSLSSLPTNINITKADLSTYCYSEGVDSGEYITFFEVSDNSWSEETVNGTNYPAFGGLLDSITPSTGWNHADVVDWVIDRYDSSIVNISFGMDCDGCDLNDLFYVRSKEYSTVSLRHYLNITYEEAAADTTPPVLTWTGTTDINTTVTTRNWTRPELSINENADNCSIVFNGTLYWMGGSATSWYYNFTGLVNYNYTFNASCNDTSGNLGNSSAIWTNISYVYVPPPPSACNCTFPNSYLVNKEINMSCYCNVTSESWCGNLTFTADTTGRLYVNSTLNATIPLPFTKTIEFDPIGSGGIINLK